MIVKYNGNNVMNPFEAFGHSMLDSLFDDVFDAPRDRSYVTKLDDGSSEIAVPLPGIGEDAIDVSIDESVVTLSVDGTKSSNAKHSFVTTCRRSWTLPRGTDVDAITAELRSGVLTIKLPSPSGQVKKKIAVSVKK